MTDEVPDELIDKMKSLGIDTKRIQFNRKNEAANSAAVTDSGGKSRSAGRRQYKVETTSVDGAQSHIKKEFTRNKQFIPQVNMKTPSN